jgi:creatinine amidohydrolase
MDEHQVLPSTASADAAVTEPRVAVLPVGAFEQHGAHLPLATDTLIAVAISNAIAEVATVRQLPPVTIGCSHEHAAFPGTLSISAGTLAAVVTDVAASLRGQGVEHLIVVNGHGGNYVLANVVQQANAERPTSMALYPNRVDWDEARAAAGMETTAHEDMHGGEIEASILLAAWPSYLRDGWPQSWKDDDHLHDDRRDLLTFGMNAYTESGIIGRPSLATEAKGHKALQILGQNAVKVMEVLTNGLPSQ